MRRFEIRFSFSFIRMEKCGDRGDGIIAMLKTNGPKNQDNFINNRDKIKQTIYQRR